MKTSGKKKHSSKTSAKGDTVSKVIIIVSVMVLGVVSVMAVNSADNSVDYLPEEENVTGVQIEDDTTSDTSADQ